MSNGFAYNGKHLSDFGCFISSRDITPPEKKQVLVTVPYMSGSYDFSTLYGGPCFEDRTITYTVAVLDCTPAGLSAKKQELINWLMACHRGPLIDDTLPDWHFTAECVAVEEDDGGVYSELSIQFTAGPFKRSNTLYTAAYTPSATAEVTADNTGTFPVVPTISCAAAATVVFGGNTRALGIGDHTDHVFELQPGMNTFQFTSSGAVTISWRTEVL